MSRKKTIQEIALLWKEDRKQYVKLSTISAYSLIIENEICPNFGSKSAVSEEDVQAFILKKLDEGLSQKTVRDILTVLKMIMKYGARKGLVSYNEWTLRFPTSGERHSVEVLGRAEQKKIMDHVRSHFTFRNLGIYICLSTGLRIGEICALKWKDINLPEGIISVRRTIGRIYVVDAPQRHTELVIDTPKTRNSAREIPMAQELVRMIRPLMKIVNHDFFILTNSDKPTEPRTYRNYYKKLMEELEMPPLKFHALRHSFATRCIESKCDYKTVSVLLGHSNISTTLDLYVHPGHDQKKRCVEQMFRSLK